MQVAGTLVSGPSSVPPCTWKYGSQVGTVCSRFGYAFTKSVVAQWSILFVLMIFTCRQICEQLGSAYCRQQPRLH